ncbi:hypothetical protein [Brevundimonas sp. GCM10030266]|uniref:hypothetical protein n=1 Tax=Brevundimonas sp. GCM10030266 TaxID=3273386 RepID=UPI0036227A20
MRPVYAFAAVATAASALSAAPVVAHEASQAPVARPVMVCATDAATRRSFTREHGAAPIFITAREVQALRPSDPTWSTPRCITATEHARLVNTSANARVR